MTVTREKGHISANQRQFAFWLERDQADAMDALALAHGRTRSSESRFAIQIHLVNHALSLLVTPEGRAQAEADGFDVDADVAVLKARLQQLCQEAYAPTGWVPDLAH